MLLAAVNFYIIVRTADRNLSRLIAYVFVFYTLADFFVGSKSALATDLVIENLLYFVVLVVVLMMDARMILAPSWKWWFMSFSSLERFRQSITITGTPMADTALLLLLLPRAPQLPVAEEEKSSKRKKKKVK